MPHKKPALVNPRRLPPRLTDPGDADKDRHASGVVAVAEKEAAGCLFFFANEPVPDSLRRTERVASLVWSGLVWSGAVKTPGTASRALLNYRHGMISRLVFCRTQGAEGFCLPLTVNYSTGKHIYKHRGCIFRRRGRRDTLKGGGRQGGGGRKTRNVCESSFHFLFVVIRGEA